MQLSLLSIVTFEWLHLKLTNYYISIMLTEIKFFGAKYQFFNWEKCCEKCVECKRYFAVCEFHFMVNFRNFDAHCHFIFQLNRNCCVIILQVIHTTQTEYKSVSNHKQSSDYRETYVPQILYLILIDLLANKTCVLTFGTNPLTQLFIRSNFPTLQNSLRQEFSNCVHAHLRLYYKN